MPLKVEDALGDLLCYLLQRWHRISIGYGTMYYSTKKKSVGAFYNKT
jgi:hypothetical protein